MKPDGSNTFTRGIWWTWYFDYNGNGDFVNSDIGINLWNWYMKVVLTGEFTAKVEGQYEFGIASVTFAVFWLDLDRDGIFETAGDNGNERLNAGTEAGDKVVERWKAHTRSPSPAESSQERPSLTCTLPHTCRCRS